jgi:hypothetical protein
MESFLGANVSGFVDIETISYTAVTVERHAGARVVASPLNLPA